MPVENQDAAVRRCDDGTYDLAFDLLHMRALEVVNEQLVASEGFSIEGYIHALSGTALLAAMAQVEVDQMVEHVTGLLPMAERLLAERPDLFRQMEPN